jgi:hypothetical protein
MSLSSSSLLARALRALLAGSAIAASLAVSGCSTPRDSGVSIRAAHSPIVRACPLGVPETRIDVEDTPDGARLHVVASDAAHAAELRARVRERVATLDSHDCP